MTGPESVVLPLHHTPIPFLRMQRYYFFRNYQNFSADFFKNTQKISDYEAESDKNHYLCRLNETL